MTFNELLSRALLLEAEQGHMLGRMHNPSGFKTQSASAGIGFIKQDPKDKQARSYYKGGVLPSDVLRGSISTPPEVKQTYNTIREAFKIVASQKETNQEITKLFIDYMAQYEQIWSFNAKVENCVNLLQKTIKATEKAQEKGEDFIKIGGKEVPCEEAIEMSENYLRDAETDLNAQINYVVDELREPSYQKILEFIKTACKSVYSQEKAKADNFGKKVTEQFVASFAENAEPVLTTIIAFLATDESKQTGYKAFARYREFIDNRSENIIHNDIIKTLNEWYKNILLRYPKNDDGLVSLKAPNRSTTVPQQYQTLIDMFKRYSKDSDSLHTLIEQIKNSNTFNDHEKSIFADAIASFYEGQGTEASVVKTIRDYGSQNAG